LLRNGGERRRKENPSTNGTEERSNKPRGPFTGKRGGRPGEERIQMGSGVPITITQRIMLEYSKRGEGDPFD